MIGNTIEFYDIVNDTSSLNEDAIYLKKAMGNYRIKKGLVIDAYTTITNITNNRIYVVMINEETYIEIHAFQFKRIITFANQLPPVCNN